VRFSSAVATDATALSNTQARATVPPAATTGPITITTPKGAAVSGQTFYVAAQITSVQPNTGSAGTSVTIRGANFTGVLAVQFNGLDATFTTVSANEIRTVVPAGATSGLISIATPAGFTSSDQLFLLPARITGIDPSSGPVGSTVTITGDNLLGATAVHFNGTDAAFVPVTATTLSATVPAGAAPGPVTVLTAAGVATSAEPFLVGVFSDLIVDLTATPDVIDVGDLVSYNVTVTNRGPFAAQNVIITDRLPAGVRTLFTPSGAPCVEANNVITCQLSELAVGGDVTIRITATVLEGVSMTNQVSVTSNNADSAPTNNSAIVVTRFKGDPLPPDPEIALGIVLNGAAFQLSWPASAPSVTLETSPSIGPAASWSGVAAPPVTVGASKVVDLSTKAGRAFYRLRKSR
jgi:uncharacterized repeat protein (TIGR01451 family)